MIPYVYGASLIWKRGRSLFFKETALGCCGPLARRLSPFGDKGVSARYMKEKQESLVVVSLTSSWVWVENHRELELLKFRCELVGSQGCRQGE